MDLLNKFRNLLVMAVADGSLSEGEYKLLADRSAKWNLSDDEFASAIDYALSGNAELSIPESKEEQTEMLRDLIRMMAANGELADAEKELFASAATTLNISEEELNQIIDSVL